MCPWNFFLMGGLAFPLMFGLTWGGKNSSPGLTGNVDPTWMACNLPKIYQKAMRAHPSLSLLHVLALACSCKTLYTLHVENITWHHVQCLRETHGTGVQGALPRCPLQRDLSWAGGWQGGSWRLSAWRCPLSTLQPTKAKTKQGCSEMMQSSGSSAPRSPPIPHQDFQGTWVP